MDVRTLLEVMVKQEASDLYLTVDAPPVYRIHGSTHRTDAPPFTNGNNFWVAHSPTAAAPAREHSSEISPKCNSLLLK